VKNDGYRKHPQPTPWWLWIIVALLVFLVLYTVLVRG
jgi:hypothetical protein